MVLASFLVFLLGVHGLIGYFAARKSQPSAADYFLAGQDISPVMLAFSSTASKFSGFIFAGFMGLAYSAGTTALWFCVGGLLGHMIAYAFVVGRLQRLNTGGWALSLGELLATWQGEHRLALRRTTGVLTLFFLSFYTAAQLKAGGKALEVVLGQPLTFGILLSAGLILYYSWSGGFRASVWTDTSQITIMSLSLLAILIMAVVQAGGVLLLWESFLATGSDPNAVALFPQNLSVGGPPGFVLFLVGAICFGMSIIGQPHLVARVMALPTPLAARQFLLVNFLLETGFNLLIFVVGMSTRVILADQSGFDPEQALFLSALEVLPAVVVGFFLAGVFSATISTADSQVLCCSAALTREIPREPRHSIVRAKLGTMVCLSAAVAIALLPENDVFSLVLFAFGGLGATLGSLLILRLSGVALSEGEALAVALVGGITVVGWNALGLRVYVNEVLPGMVAAGATYLALRLRCNSQSTK